MENQTTNNEEAQQIANGGPEGFGVKLARIFRIILYSTIAFLIGGLVIWLGLFRPLASELERAENELGATLQENEDLENEVARLEQIQSQSEVLKVLVDVNLARIAILEDNIELATDLLIQNKITLESLASDLDQKYSDLIASQIARIELAIDELENEQVFNAQRDLEVLVNLLLELDTQLID